ncbi:MAG: YtxH domain-containing protein [Eggerthellaceae bacterium]|nr:YtxH domain-containing protein [Eggerthellaceae bacterium]
MGRISSFVTGAALGVIAALLLAPQTGEQTRALVAEKANAVTDEAKDFGAGFPASAQDAIKSAQEKAASLTKGVAAPAAPAASVADDELREKIEAARQRIAAQVAANAEATKAAAEEVQEAVAE